LTIPRQAATDALIARVFREEAGRLTASLVRILGNFDEAEELVQDAILAALEHWPRDGIPDRPGAWLWTTARRRAVDRWRRQTRYQEKLALLDGSRSEPALAVDDRLRLIFTCCHPALSREAQLALTLRAIIGLTTTEIARAFLTSEATIAQRIVRAKRKIVDAAIPYRVPDPAEFPDRLDEVLAVLYLMFNEAYLTTSGAEPARHDLATDAEWLTGLLVRLLPDEPEPMGLLALIRLHRARARARFDDAGRLVLLPDQDRRLWDRTTIEAAVGLIQSAARSGRTGPYQLQAAIAACHAEAPSFEQTDWEQIVLLYRALLRRVPSPVVQLNYAIALRHVAGPEVALAEAEQVGPALQRYHLYHATRAQLLRALGRGEEARDADARALQLTANPAERALLEERLAQPLS
jgi:RNA polymerase sigma factor (sigma-70 family)